MAKNKTFPFSVELLEQVLRLSPESISLESLKNGFGIKRKDQKPLEVALNDLKSKGLVQRCKKGRYQSTKPIADIVTARVEEDSQGKKFVALKLLGIKGQQPFTVTLPTSQIRKLEQKEGKKLVAGNKVAVVLERSGGLNFKSRNLIGRIEHNKRLHLTVAFSKAAKGKTPKVSSVAPISLTSFNASGKIPEEINFRKDFRAALPENYSPYHPTLEVEDARWDPETGLAVHAIVANKNNIPERHSPEAELEAQRMLTANFWKDKSRRDLRDERILVIDPPNAHDNDDGILIEHTDKIIDGQRAYYRTLVVIADVPFYVRPGSQMEKEAKDRGFTHYFEGHALHLYPSVFADSKSSLKKGRVRPVIYTEKFWDADGNQIGDADIGAGIIESQKVMTYGQFQNLIDSNDPSVWAYQELGDKFIQQYRHDEGLVFDSINNDLNASYARSLVASMMQDTGQEMADMLHHRDIPFLRRAHGAKDNLYAYEECCSALSDMGYHLPSSPFDITIQDIQDVLSEADARQERPSVERYVRQYLLHQAKYTTIDTGHFALNKRRYTHGTSPIRRYPDLLTLRGVHTALGNEDLGLSEDDVNTMQDVAEKMNRLQDVQKTVALDYERYNSVARLTAHENMQRNVTLSGIKYPYIYIDVALGKQGALRKEVEISDLPNMWSVSREHNKLLYRNNVEVPIGETLKVTIRDVKPEMGDWSFDNMLPTPKAVAAAQSKLGRNTLTAKVS